MMIGMGMSQLNMPELTAMVTSAVGKFLKEKGTLFVDVTPNELITGIITDAGVLTAPFGAALQDLMSQY